MLSSRAFYILLLLLFAADVSRSQESLVRQWLPIGVGNRWIYDMEGRSGSRANPDVEHWILEETTVAVEKLPEGTLLRQKIRFLNNAAPPARMRILDESAILVHGACIYYLNAGHHGWGWDPAQHQLSAEFREYLNRGEALPSACFPLHLTQTWGDPNRGRDLWTVAGTGPKNQDDPPAGPEAWRLEANLASGDDDYVWFRKGVGVAAERTYHNGTYNDLRVRLVSFEPAGLAR